jgi:aerobic-type carbon monoxide dehydrogenase small subunit (CoxS/CutS family)
VQAEAARIQTVEGPSHHGLLLRRLQAAFHRRQGPQCGFCTPGILLSLAGSLAVKLIPDEMSMRKMLSGDLCRCTGNTTAMQAAVAAAMPKAEENEDRPGV